MPITLTLAELNECFLAAGETTLHWSDLAFQKLQSKGARYAIRPHRPGFVDATENPADYIGVHTREELYAVPYVTRWAAREDFDHWQEEHYGSSNLLVAYLKNEQRYVVAYWVGFED